jgi:hypothetical protein
LRDGGGLRKQVLATARTLPRFSGAEGDRNVSFVAVERGADRGRRFSGVDADRNVSIGARESLSSSRGPAITTSRADNSYRRDGRPTRRQQESRKLIVCVSEHDAGGRVP